MTTRQRERPGGAAARPGPRRVQPGKPGAGLSPQQDSQWLWGGGSPGQQSGEWREGGQQRGCAELRNRPSTGSPLITPPGLPSAIATLRLGLPHPQPHLRFPALGAEQL